MKTSAITASVIGIVVAAVTTTSVEGFAPSSFGVQRSTALSMSTTSKISQASIRKSIEQMTAENFDATLKEIEPFLSKEAGATFLSKSQRRIARNAKVFGKTVPSDYLKEAKATAKRREKQAAFIQAKIEEAAAAAEEAAAAAAAEAEAAASAAEAPAEE
jgi:hypothetical protein